MRWSYWSIPQYNPLSIDEANLTAKLDLALLTEAVQTFPYL